MHPVVWRPEVALGAAMYGLLIDNVVTFIRLTYGEDVWNEVKVLARLFLLSLS